MAANALTEPLRETLALFDDSGTPRTTSELADRLDLGRRSTYDRLERLVERGELETKSVGASARVWWRPRSSADPSWDSGGRSDPEFRSVVDPVEEYAICQLDPSGRVRTWNAGAERITGCATDDALDEHVSTFYAAEGRQTTAPETMLETAAEGGSARTDGRFVRADGSTFWAAVTVDAIRDGEGELEGYVCIVRETTGHREKERELRRQRDLAERLIDAAPVRLLITDADGSVERLNSRARRDLGIDTRESSDPRFVWDAFELYDPDGDPISAGEHPVTIAIETEELVSEAVVRYDDRDGDRRWVTLTASPVFGDDGNVERVVVAGNDVTDRRRTRRRLERQREELEAKLDEAYSRIDDGFFALDDDLRLTLVNRWAGELVGRRSEDLVGERVRDVFDLGPKTSAAFEEAVRTQRPTSVEEYHESFEAWFEHHVYPSETGLSVYFRDVTRRKTRETELKRQHEQLEALNNLHTVVRGITDAVTERSTREEIEHVVCEHLAETESYLFAWIGDVDVTTQTVDCRTEAGVDGYLDGITISVDPDDERSKGPTGRAIAKRETQTTQDIRADTRHDPWRSHIEKYGFRSSAAIPIVHEETVYGVLNVYAERPRAFEGRERDVIGQLGELVGHAIAATERKRALMSDVVVELEFRIRDVFDALDVDGSSAGTISLDHTVPIEDDEYLVYGRATADAIDGLEALVETLPHWVDLTYRTDGDERGFELRLSEPPVLSTVASIGGAVDTAVIEDDDYRMTLHLAPGTDVRTVVDTVQEAYPDAELLTQHQRRIDTSERVRDVLGANLTDRQRAVLEAAYHAGYYEWPRDASGEVVAESLDIAPPTFHQHLRKAHRKVFDSLLSTPIQRPSG
ncbi:bacterio-opsin activator domain-containing protein [Natrialbaceae archaeon GCM10025810]|uniref:bacterio-opsin activator domain-containing protein n=1 Tax=Halovalidus salilacus TaxID=3075124 RepID=UPI0036177B0E